jgi:hypothetical protein
MRAVCDEVASDLNFGPQASLWSAPSHISRRSYLTGAGRQEHQAAADRDDFVAPDDNPAFLLELERWIRGENA